MHRIPTCNPFEQSLALSYLFVRVRRESFYIANPEFCLHLCVLSLDVRYLLLLITIFSLYYILFIIAVNYAHKIQASAMWSREEDEHQHCFSP